MRHNYLSTVILFLALILGMGEASAQMKPTVRLDATNPHQHITGFGGFVCSPGFAYNHMSTAEIKKVWGPQSTVGCNIMRLYIPIGRNAWSQSLQTAKTAKQMGLIVFASPWGQPAEWKTNGTSNAKNSDGTTGKLKRENWPDYAQYLEDYVQYLRSNGVELDAISIQNEPDWPATYAGCLWSASEIAEFVKTYGRSISCKIMAPETLAISDSYVNELNKSDVLPNFDIYGGHQYGGVQSGYKNLASKGKEIWMTEYLINWNEAENNTRDFDYSKDVFNFFRAINTCMIGDFNAWVHYAAKRYYGMLGDGQRGTSNGTVTKRGCVMAHFARFVTGMTRIDATFSGTSLEGSAYLSTSGDTTVVVIANEAAEDVNLTIDLPFYTTSGTICTTTKSRNMVTKAIEVAEETCRPTADIPAQGVSTLLFIRSRDRQPSNMRGVFTLFDRIDDMSTTKSAFGNNYMLSGKTKTFDHSSALISNNKNASSGYVALDDRYSQLVMQVKSVSSTLNYTSSLTTLTYINAKGEVSTHDYGELDLTRRENFDIVFDLSPQTLPDGCRGLISITNNNYSSKLTITFGTVYLSNGGQYSAKLRGAYVADDSNVLDFTTDPSCTSIDMTGVSQLPASLPWVGTNNRVVYVSESSPLSGDNVITSNICHNLALSSDGGGFRPEKPFTADSASLTLTVEGFRLAIFPFSATIPEGAKAYTIAEDMSLIQMRSIPPHTPVLIEGNGELIFKGSGEISYATSPLDNVFRGTFTPIPLYSGDYILGQKDGEWGLTRLTDNSALAPFGVYATPASTADFIPFTGLQSGIVNVVNVAEDDKTVYSLQGIKVSTSDKWESLPRGIYIIGKRLVQKR